MYGYKSSEYGARGIIVSNNCVYTYFDKTWTDNHRIKVYEQDFDHDGIVETALYYSGGSITGVSIYRPIMLDDVEKTEKTGAYEFMPEIQLEQFESKLQFDVNMQTKERS